MDSLIEAIRYLTALIFVALAVVTFAQWRRRRLPAGRWAALTFGTLAAVTFESALVERLRVEPGIVLEKVSIALLVLFPYFLYRFTGSFSATTRFSRVAAWATGAVLLITVIVPRFPSDGGEPGWFLAYLGLFLAQWSFLSFVAAQELWRAGRGQPTLVRRRMRTLSLAAAGMVAALLIAVAGSAASPDIVSLLVQILGLASGLGFFLGLAPPPALRTAWRRAEEQALQEAVADLMGATTVEEVTNVLLPHVAAIVGAHHAVLIAADGSASVSHGEDGTPAPGAAGDGVASGTCEDVPLRPPFAALRVWTTPHTPYFGADDIRVLHSLGALANLALERVVLTSNERDARAALERANERLSATNDELSREVKRRERAQETLRKQAELLDLTNDNIFVCDLDSRIRYWNRGAERTYGWTAEEAIGKRVHDLLKTRFPAPLAEITEQVLDRGSWEGELQHTCRDGSVIIASSRWALQRDSSGRPAAVLETNNNITKRKEAEQALVEARKGAEDANRAKSEFLSRMSHELRTPLNAILGFGQLLEMEDLDDQQQESVSHVLKAGRHLLGLIDEVLEIARIEAGGLTVSAEPVLAAEVVRETVDMVAPLASDKGINVEVEGFDGGYVLADRQRLKQVLLNLLSNAIKYNRVQGSVRVSCAPSDAGRCRLVVSDTGPGISGDKLDDLFVPFERLGAETSGVEGTGLGLALSQSLVQVMGGRLSVESTVGEGSTFSIDLPVADSPLGSIDNARDVGARAERVPEGTVVLYVEDNLSNLRLVEQVLKLHSSTELITAMQGRMGLELARQHDPDIVLLDLHLPDMPGDEVLRRLRADEATRDLPVVMISADATKRSIRRLLDLGATDYLTKPLDIVRFLDALAAHVPEKVS